MPVTTTWASPATADESGGLDLSTGDTLSETVIDRYASDLYRLGGTDGNAKTGPYQIGGGTSYSNTFNTGGLTVNQAAADDEALALKSSDVAHGMTTIAETDTYAKFLKSAAAGGGLQITGLDDGGGSAHGALLLTGDLGQAANTAHTVVGYAVVRISSQIKSGTGVAAVGANGNLFSVDNAGTVAFIVDAEGDIFADAGSGAANTGQGYYAYDDFDDAALVRALDLARAAHAETAGRVGTVQRGLIRSEWDRFVAYNEQTLVDLGILGAPLAEGGLTNVTRLQKLHNGAIWQQHTRVQAVLRRLAALEAHTGLLPASPA